MLNCTPHMKASGASRVITLDAGPPVITVFALQSKVILVQKAFYSARLPRVEFLLVNFYKVLIRNKRFIQFFKINLLYPIDTSHMCPITSTMLLVLHHHHYTFQMRAEEAGDFIWFKVVFNEVTASLTKPILGWNFIG